MISILYDPLFTAVDLEGRAERFGLLELLAQAHRLSDLKANSCTGKLALLRLCMAFLLDAYRPEGISERADLLERGSFDPDVMADYVRRCEAKGPRFLLDDEAYPFMQAAYDAELDGKAEKPVSKILFDVPGGNNHIHLDHRYEDQHEADTAAAFEAMLETYLFCPAGLSGASNVNNTPPLMALLHGGSLFETLVLNMVSKDEIANIPFGGGEAAWERQEKIVPGAKTVQMSLLKGLTWQPRRLTLRWDEDGMIRRLYLQNGLNFQGNGLWQDPHVLYRQVKDGGMVSIKPELGRELWRDAGTLLCKGRGGRSTLPLQNIDDVGWENRPRLLDIEMIGMITNNEAILGRVHERLSLPEALFMDEDRAAEFRDALELCERMFREVDKAVKWQYCNPGDKKKRSAVAQQAGEAFLQAMHGTLFKDYLSWLEDLDAAERERRYQDAMWDALEGPVLREVVERTGYDVASLKRQNAVRGKIRKEYKAIWERS